jgi:hypothetical protein
VIENFLIQEFYAGPEESRWATIFQTGDEIVFRGKARATLSGNDPSDIVVRAFIKTLGYNQLGWEFQEQPAYTAYANIGPDEEPFELRITYPDITIVDHLQVIQLGFEIRTAFDGHDMDAGTITFRDLEGVILSAPPAGP